MIDGRIYIEKLPVQIQHYAHIELMNMIDQLFQLLRSPKRGTKQAWGIRWLHPADVLLRITAGLLQSVQLDNVDSDQLDGFETIDDGFKGSGV